MTASQATFKLEQAIGHDTNATTAQDMSNPALVLEAADPSGETLQALAWMGKNKVKVLTVPKPAIIEPRDVIVRVTGSTVCGSDLHLLHGVVTEMQKGDNLGHEFCGIVDEIGPNVKGLKKG